MTGAGHQTDWEIIKVKLGVILVDHGSQRVESNELLLAVAAQLKLETGWPIVEPAHMELAEPTIDQAFDRCLEQGAEQLVIHPFFLGLGRHCSEHIPELIRRAASRHHGIPFRITSPLAPDPLLLEIVKRRIDAEIDR